MVYDFLIIGGGIVGLATAMELLAVRPGSSLVLLDTEAAVASHQTGRNSGVIHAGLYYAPRSLTAAFCRRVAVAPKAFFAYHGIAFETSGEMRCAPAHTTHYVLHGHGR